jgi:hypothetical protein
MGERPTLLSLSTISEIFLFIFIFCGNAFGGDRALYLGMVIFILVCIACLREIFVIRKINASSVFFCCQLYFLMVAFSAAISRLEFGVGQAWASRYSTFSLLTFVSVLAYWYMQDLKRFWRLAVPTISILFAAALAFEQPYKMSRNTAKLDNHKIALAYLAAGATDHERIGPLHPNADTLVTIFERSQQANLPWFANNLIVQREVHRDD